MNLKLFHFNFFNENTYLLWKEDGRAVAVDPGAFSESEQAGLLDFMGGKGLKPEAILLTHAHFDHIAGVRCLQRAYPGIPVYLSPRDRVIFGFNGVLTRGFGIRADCSPFETIDIDEGDVIRAAGFGFEVISTPGHTPGGVCFLERSEKALFTGDTLFAGTIGRTDLMYGDYDLLIKGIMEKLIWLDPDTAVHPGHGPSSDIGTERRSNPMLEPFNEREELEDLSSDELPHD